MSGANTRHQIAALDAAAMIQRHDGRALDVASREIDQHLRQGDVDAALQMDQVRREIEATQRRARSS